MPILLTVRQLFSGLPENRQDYCAQINGIDPDCQGLLAGSHRQPQRPGIRGLLTADGNYF